jgi:hypothetical protein
MAALPFELDPLIAEARRRMHRRRLLAVIVLVAAAGAAVGVVFLLRSGGPGALRGTATQPGFARIPGMTLIASDRSTVICAVKGTDMYPAYCTHDGIRVTKGLDQTWALSSAVARYGSHRQLPPVAFAQRHPGPATVSVEVRTFQPWHGAKEANVLLHTPDYVGSDNVDYKPLPAAVDGGLAGEMASPSIAGMKELRFAWASGTSVVIVNVIGADLAVGEAQRVALLAGPA